MITKSNLMGKFSREKGLSQTRCSEAENLATPPRVGRDQLGFPREGDDRFRMLRRPAARRRRPRASVGKISAKCCSFSAVSAPIFARKYAFCSIFQNLPDYLAEIFDFWQIFANFATFAIFC